MRMVQVVEHRQEFLEGFYFNPTVLEKSGPGWIIRAGLSQAKPHYHMGPKISHYHYLIFVVEGEGRLLQNGQSYPLGPGDVFCLFPNTPHEYFTLKHAPMLTIWVAFDGRQMQELLGRAGLTPQLPVARRALSPELTGRFESFFEQCRSPGKADPDLFRLGFFYGLFESLSAAHERPGHRDCPAESWLQRGAEYIQMHYAQGITIDNVSSYVSIDRTHFTKKFSERFGISPGKYLQQLKLNEAKRLLTETDYKLAEVARLVGFPDLFTFSKSFKRAYGAPPSDYRPGGESSRSIPEGFLRRITAVHGKPGEQWYHDLPRLLTYCRIKWNMRVLPPFPSDGSSYVAPVVFQNGMEAVLKLGYPCRAQRYEIEALKAFDGHGTVKLLDAEADRGVLLLEKAVPAVPGLSLAGIGSEEEIIRIAARHIRVLGATEWKPLDHPLFPSTSDWATELEEIRAAGPATGIPGELAVLAERAFHRLHAGALQLRLLHGNLKPEHLLAAKSGWTSIHPKGLLGEWVYEAIPFAVRRLPEQAEEARILLRRRLHLFAEELGCEVQRLLAWGLCHTVSAAWHRLQFRGEGGSEELRAAHLLAEEWKP
ncbi:aminoglycoside phosphotransferase family protein [Gorillibacterium sp. sgz5001074]|uniref:aminoglycoside phosphotransferase family protein n=1 Tax=Gorillibacterium sp. sgz5001074 TaxID=3446695 RepID=UPI003F67191F